MKKKNERKKKFPQNKKMKIKKVKKELRKNNKDKTKTK